MYATNDKKIQMLRRFEEKSEVSGRRSLIKDAKKYAGELDLHLNLVHPGQSEYFAWMSERRSAPTHTVADMQELYLQMLPTKIYHHKKTRCHTGSDLTCRLCSKAPETQAHALAGCCT